MAGSVLDITKFDEPTTSVSLKETHVSYIFLTDKYVYKIKKPVNLGFLDFSTLERRRYYCNQEVRLNSRLCPWIYLGVVEVRDGNDGIAIGGEGTLVDYAVKMRRLPEECMLHHLLKNRSVHPEMVRRIAAVVADFHKGAARGEVINSYGKLETISSNWGNNLRQIETLSPATIAPADLALIKGWGESFLVSHAPQFERRVERGFIRDCDGDLHADNICVTDRICIFDCIEFNDRFRYSDTAADIAFLLMDFDFHGRADLGSVFLNEYTRRTNDSGAAGVIPFYKLYRALIRGKVESIAGGEAAITGGTEGHSRSAERYFRLARGYCLRGKLTTSLIITCGLMGSGKSVTAAELAFQLGTEVLSSDRLRKSRAGIGDDQHYSVAYREGIYSTECDTDTYAALFSEAEDRLRTGQSVLVDASFRRKHDRMLFQGLARRLKIPFYLLYFRCPEEVVRERLLEREKDPTQVSDGRWDLYHLQKMEFEPPEGDEGEQIFIDTTTPLHDNVDLIMKALGVM